MASRFINPWSRLAVDPERLLDPAEEEMEAVGMGAVYTRLDEGTARIHDGEVRVRDLVTSIVELLAAELTDAGRS